MKAIFTLLLFSIWLGLSGAANASAVPGETPQTADCGDNVPSLNNVINSKFLGVFRANYVDAFIGKWGQGLMPLVISASGTFNFYGFNFIACPQRDGSIYVYKIGDPHEGGFLKLDNSKQITVYGGKGLVSAANGSYVRAK